MRDSRYSMIRQGNRGHVLGKLVLAALRRRTGRMKTGELRQYHYFLVLAQELHFGRAAEKCFVTQSALSQQISRLEELLDVKLFVRDPRQVALTPAGEVLKEGVAKIFADIDSLTRRTRAQAGLEDLQLSVGLVEYANIPLVPASLMRLQSLYPALKVARHEMHSAHQADALQRKQIDVGLGVALERPADGPAAASATTAGGAGISCAPLASSQWRLLMRADHPLAHAGRLDLDGLAQARLIMFARDVNPPAYDGLMQACQAAGVAPNVVYHTSQAQAGIQLAREGVGVMLGTGYVLGDPPPGLLTVPLDGFRPLAIQVQWRTGESRPLIRDFVEILLEEARRHDPGTAA